MFRGVVLGKTLNYAYRRFRGGLVFGNGDYEDNHSNLRW